MSFAARIFFPIPIIIPIILLTAWFFFDLLAQFKNRKIMLNMNENKETTELLDKISANNNKGYKNTIDAVSEIIEDSNNTDNI